VIKEVVLFRLPLGPRTDEFVALYRQVRATMEANGVNPGVAWTTTAGTRSFMIEREFDSLAAFEADDAVFHGGETFMALWRRMEACAESMESQLWQTAGDRAQVEVVRAKK
jgi:hypothetical protein